jgi:16S rRNA (cytosine1402-N4)-methyltransferase
MMDISARSTLHAPRSTIHTSVLLHEVIVGLDITDGDIVVDATIGNGGHSEGFFSTGKDIRIIAIDLDLEATARSQKRLAKFADRITYINDSFRNLSQVLKRQKISTVSKILFDFGLSSNQLEESGRGFSFNKDEALVMTFKSDSDQSDLTARDVVNDWEEESLREIIRGFGEEKFAGRIARGIVERRAVKPIETTGELVEVILSVTPTFYHRGRIHPATRTFQAIRIAVNDELEAIKEGLKGGFDSLAPNGRMAAISFHSLEDRIVKQYFRGLQREEKAAIQTKKPIVPSESERESNPRSRSAKLRIIEKIHPPKIFKE